jgi:hypothetical protein
MRKAGQPRLLPDLVAIYIDQADLAEFQRFKL